MTTTKKLLPYPDFRGDDDAEQAFMDTHDLSEYDFAPNAIPRDQWFTLFEQYKKDVAVNLRISKAMLDEVKKIAGKKKMAAQRLMRYYIELGIQCEHADETKKSAKRVKGRRAQPVKSSKAA